MSGILMQMECFLSEQLVSLIFSVYLCFIIIEKLLWKLFIKNVSLRIHFHWPCGWDIVMIGIEELEFIKKYSSLFFMFSIYFNVANIFVEIAGICDNEVYHYQLNLKESASARRLTRLPSNPKNGVKFRHASYLNFIFCWFVDYLANCLMIIFPVGLKCFSPSSKVLRFYCQRSMPSFKRFVDSFLQIQLFLFCYIMLVNTQIDC